MIAQETIDAIRENASVIEVIGEHVVLKQKGANFLGLCPFHDEKTPSFNVRSDDNFYHCFGCGVSGNVITFVMQYHGLSFPEAVEQLAARFGIEIRHIGRSTAPKKSSASDTLYRINEIAGRYYSEALQSALGESTRNKLVAGYLKDRALDPETGREFSVGFAPKEWRGLTEYFRKNSIGEEAMLASGLVRRNRRGELYDLFRGRLIFPILKRKGVIAGFGARLIPPLFSSDESKESPKYVNSPESEVYHKSKILFGWPQALDTIRRSGEVHIVEGYMDVLSLWRVGVRNVVATCGTALTSDHVKALSKVVNRAYLLFDGDAAGQRAAARSFSLFLNSGMDAEAVFFPDGEDPDSVAVSQGESTKDYLKGLPHSSLLYCHLDAIFQRFGVQGAKELGAASKGKVCHALAETLRGVENQIERYELVREAVFKLLVSEEELLEILGEGTKPSKSPPKMARETKEVSTVDQSGVKPITKLPRVDRDLLYAVMVDKGPRLELILMDPEICTALDPSTRMFVEGLQSIIEQQDLGDQGKKESALLLLKSFGNDWIGHWREAFELFGQPDVDLEQSFRQCCETLRKDQVRTSLLEIDREIQFCELEEHKLALLQEKVALERRLRSL